MNETELKSRFAHLRSELASSAPSLRAVLAAPPPAQTRVRFFPSLAWAVPSLGLLTLLWWQLGQPGTSRRTEPLPSGAVEVFSTWGTPTDSLLRAPGTDLGSLLPTIGLPAAQGDRLTPGEPSSRTQTRRIA